MVQADHHRPKANVRVGLLRVADLLHRIRRALGFAFTFNGSTWSGPTSVLGQPQSVSVSCLSTTFCVAVPLSGKFAMEYNGSTWEPMFGWLGEPATSSVSCASKWYCVAVAQFGLTQVWNGTTWVLIDPSLIAPTKVSCPTSSLCVVVGNGGQVQLLDQGQWSKVLTVDPGHNLTAVACGAISYCVALDSVGNEVTYNGTWSSPETLDSVSLEFPERA